MDKLKQKLKDVPQGPGVYQFQNKDGEVIYVGKAKNLRARVGQYLNKQDERPQIPYLLAEMADFDYTVVNNELESLFLENTIIKQHLPKYNIMLRDDKNYAFIKIDYSTEIPKITIARKINNHGRHPEPRVHPRGEGSLKPNKRDSSAALGMTKKPKFFGPYSAAYKIRDTLDLTRRIFSYCAADKVGSRPCFYYYLHRCPGVCVGKISLDEYRQHLQKIEDFLAGDTAKIKKQLETEMKISAGKQEFEKAARLRDQQRALQLLEEHQTVILTKAVSWDIVSIALDQGFACVNLFKVRDGKLFDKENFIFEISSNGVIPSAAEGSLKQRTRGIPRSGALTRNDTIQDTLQTFLEQYYLEASSIPATIYTQTPAEDHELIEHIIRSRFNLSARGESASGGKSKILNPKKGKPAELIKLGITNAQEYLKNWLQSQAGHLDKINQALEGLKNTLNLKKVPDRIECYDISNIQGTNAVGSMVVFKQGLPAKSEYRKFKIKTKSTPDDFAMMREMLSRRIARLPASTIARSSSKFSKATKQSPTKAGLPRPSAALGARNGLNTWPLPDLIVIDGGKGQLSAAQEVLLTTNYLLPTIGLAKRIEEIFIPGQTDPIILSHDDPTLQLLQRLRDEAHRFGITYHRDLRSKQAVKSALDDVPGIGPKTKKLLKQKFGTVAAIRKASLDSLSEVIGKRIAQLIQQNL